MYTMVARFIFSSCVVLLFRQSTALRLKIANTSVSPSLSLECCFGFLFASNATPQPIPRRSKEQCGCNKAFDTAINENPWSQYLKRGTGDALGSVGEADAEPLSFFGESDYALGPKQDDLLIIFDWDDTLFITSYATQGWIPALPNAALHASREIMVSSPVLIEDSVLSSLPQDPRAMDGPPNISQVAAALQVELNPDPANISSNHDATIGLANLAEQVLRKAAEVGHTAIITNGQPTWIEWSSLLWCPNILPMLGRSVLFDSAQSYLHQLEAEFQSRDKANNLKMWKVQAFKNMVHRIETERGTTIQKMLALGDSSPEIEAAITFRDEWLPIAENESVPVSPRPGITVQTVELAKTPNFVTMRDQLRKMLKSLEDIEISNGDFPIERWSQVLDAGRMHSAIQSAREEGKDDDSGIHPVPSAD